MSKPSYFRSVWNAIFPSRVVAVEPVQKKRAYLAAGFSGIRAHGLAEFQALVPFASDKARQGKGAAHDYAVNGLAVDVRTSGLHLLSVGSDALSWTFSLTGAAQSCDFVCCICMNKSNKVQLILVIPVGAITGLQTIGVPCEGRSRWKDYAITPKALASHLNLRKQLF